MQKNVKNLFMYRKWYLNILYIYHFYIFLQSLINQYFLKLNFLYNLMFFLSFINVLSFLIRKIFNCN